MDDRSDFGQNREEELPEHETRPEDDEGGGLTSMGISAEQRGPIDGDVLEAGDEDAGEPEIDPDQPPPAHRIHTG